jgi:nucleolar protein 12
MHLLLPNLLILSGYVSFISLQDEELYQLFTGIKDLASSIEAVRVIRHPHIGLGKGIAYVLFKTRV